MLSKKVKRGETAESLKQDFYVTFLFTSNNKWCYCKVKELTLWAALETVGKIFRDVCWAYTEKEFMKKFGGWKMREIYINKENK